MVRVWSKAVSKTVITGIILYFVVIMFSAANATSTSVFKYPYIYVPLFQAITH